MPVECSYFKEYFDESVSGQYRKRDVKKWCEKNDASVIRPIFNWTAQEVIDYILENKQDVNPLYKKGSMVMLRTTFTKMAQATLAKWSCKEIV